MIITPGNAYHFVMRHFGPVNSYGSFCYVVTLLQFRNDWYLNAFGCIARLRQSFRMIIWLSRHRMLTSHQKWNDLIFLVFKNVLMVFAGLIVQISPPILCKLVNLYDHAIRSYRLNYFTPRVWYIHADNILNVHYLNAINQCVCWIGTIFFVARYRIHPINGLNIPQGLIVCHNDTSSNKTKLNKE